MSAPCIQTVGLVVRAGERRLLDGVCFALPPGSLTVLLGPNGAGKTTLLRTLTGICRAHAGKVLLDGRRIETFSRRRLAQLLAYLPQQNATVFDVRVEDVVTLGRFPHLGCWGGMRRHDCDRVAWALERVGLTPLRTRRLRTLSGGERQRVFVARALAQEAPTLVLDEPIAALDVGKQLDLLALLRDLHAEGRTILAALHDIRPALEFFPRALLLDAGRLVADAPTAEVLHSSAFRQAFGVQVERAESVVFRVDRRADA